MSSAGVSSKCRGDGVKVTQAVLARPLVFEGLALPKGTAFMRQSDDWSFTTPKGSPARRAPAGDADQPDFVVDARRTQTSTFFQLTRPFHMGSTGLTFRRWLERQANGCLRGDALGDTLFGVPADGSATWCRGRIVAAEAAFPIPNLRVGRWYATSAVEGDASTLPARPGRPCPAVPCCVP